MAAPDAMLYWLARAAKQSREAAGRKQVHVAAEADKDQSSIYRFESAGGWPRDTDRLVAAYAADLDVEAIDLWEEALRMWREHLELGDVSELPADERAARAVERPARSTRAPRRAAGKGRGGGHSGTPDR